MVTMTRILLCILPTGLALSLGLGLATPLPGGGQEHAHGQAQSGSAPPTSIRITMDALHAAGGVPRGWRFSLPAGGATPRRPAVVGFKCYARPALKGEHVPPKPGAS